MTLETFFEKFDQFADAPNAVAKMRELVLQLAVQGKLGEQNAEDEPAESLNERILVSLEVIAGRVGVRFIKPSALIELCDDLPAGWGIARLQSIGITQTGTTPSKSEPSFEGNHIPFIKPGDITGDVIDYENEGLSIGGLGVGRLIPRDSILMVSIGGSIGKAALVDRDVSCNQQINSVTPADCIEPGFILAVIRSQYFQNEVSSRAAQGTLPIISKSKWETISVPLPPLAEQKRIVAKVDKLMALCDRLEAQQRERDTRQAVLARAAVARFADAPTPANIDLLFHKSYTIPPADLRKTILTLAVQGKLVPQNPNDEPASVLLKRILSEKERLAKEGKIHREASPVPATVDELQFELRPGWEPATISQILVELQTGPFGSSLHKSDYQRDGIPVINPASIKNEQLVPIDGMAIGSATLARLATFKLRVGDIVMARRGEMGRCAVVANREEGWLCGTGCLILRLPECVFSRFFVTVIGSPFVREYLGGSAVGITMQNLNQSILLRLVIGLPPLAEQCRIVAKVDQLMALVDRLETQLTASRATAATLTEAVVAELTEVRMTVKSRNATSYRKEKEPGGIVRLTPYLP